MTHEAGKLTLEGGAYVGAQGAVPQPQGRIRQQGPGGLTCAWGGMAFTGLLAGVLLTVAFG